MGSLMIMRSSTLTDPNAKLYKERTNTSPSSSVTMLKLAEKGMELFNGKK